MTEYNCDVLVVGSGAGGLATAVAAAHHHQDVLVVEKEPVFGGTTARSGGWLWVPASPHARRAGVDDSAEKARTYLAYETGAHFNPARVDAYLDTAPQAVDFFEKNTALQFDLGMIVADYHPDSPGGMSGGRSIVARPFDGRELGDEIKRLRPPLREITLFGVMIGAGKELQHFFNVTRSPVSALFVGKFLLRFLRDLVFHGRSMRLANGNALAARLAKSCFDKNIPIWTRSPARRLIKDSSGRVVGAEVETPTGPVTVRTRKGVVLAAGGFPQDPIRRKKLFPHDHADGYRHASPAPPGNTGDGLTLAESIGASVDESLPHAAAWLAVSRPPRADGTLAVYPHFVDRGKPGFIAVTRSGKRFVNEADSYHDFCQSMYKRSIEENSEVCAFLIADHRAFRRYGLGFARPSPVPFGRHIRSGYLIRGATLKELAGKIGADPAQLEKTVAMFNANAREGSDPEFHKGTNAYNRSLGDLSHQPNACLAPLETGPFYAVKIVIGDLGTFAGLRCDEYSRVLDEAGAPIPGLYAAGNDAASIMGGNYPGGGITLGPAVTFGYIAARHLAGAN
jgi:succinate dehydrogenase/fumarate reductase flavoprotein subunit